MNAADFYRLFLDGVQAQPLPTTFKQLSGPRPSWSFRASNGTVKVSFSTNQRLGGIPQNILLGECFVRVLWRHDKRDHRVSVWQHATRDDALDYSLIQRRVLNKYLAIPGRDPLTILSNYSMDPEWAPRPGMDDGCLYLDDSDAYEWGRWHATFLPIWAERFTISPESEQDWCARAQEEYLRNAKART
jgi:hypothetical protein